MKKTKNILFTFISWIVLLIFLFPIYFLITSSMKRPEDIFAKPPKLFIFDVDFNSYYKVLFQTNIKEYIINSLIICFATVIIAMIVGFLAAYSLNRFEFKGKKNVSFWIISIRMGPPVMVMIPIFLIVNRFGIYDSHLALIIIYLMFNIPFVVWMLRSYLNQIPVEIEEAATIEGCNNLMIFRYIIFPLTKMGFMATFIISFIFSWNEFFFAFLLTGSESKTVPVAIQRYITQTGIRWDELTTAGTVIIIPILIISLIVGRYFIRGLIEGSSKG